MSGSHEQRSIPIMIPSQVDRSLEEFPRNVRVLGVAEATKTQFDLKSPLIIRGACDRAKAKWTEEWLVNFFGETPCSVSLDSRPAMKANKQQCSLRQYLERHSDPNTDEAQDATTRSLEYLFHSKTDANETTELLSELDLPQALLHLGATGLYRFFSGPAVAGTLPHVHTHAINALVRGRKRWAVYVGEDDDETVALIKEAYAAYGSGSQAKAWFDAECPKLRSRYRHVWEFMQVAGDVVFVPAYHLHAVINLEPVMGFTAEFASDS